MFAPAALALTLLAAEPPAPAKVKVAVPGLTRINIDEAQANFYSEHLAQQLKFAGFEIVTQREIGAMLGLERQKQLLGCGDEASGSCMIELANALGTDGVLLGDLARVGTKTQINVKIIGSSDGATLTAYSDRVEGDEAVLDSLSRGAQLMGEAAAVKLGRKAATKRAEASIARKWSWAPAAFGLILGSVGVYFLVQANAAANQLKDAVAGTRRLTAAEATVVAESGRSNQTLGAITLGVGAAAIAAGVAMFVFGGTTNATVAFVPGGATFGFAGSF